MLFQDCYFSLILISVLSYFNLFLSGKKHKLCRGLGLTAWFHGHSSFSGFPVLYLSPETSLDKFLSSALTPYLTEQLYVFSAYAREPLLGACFRHLTHPLYGDLINRLPGTPPPHPPSIFSPSCFLFLLHFLSVLLRLFAHHPHCRRPGPPGPHVCSLSAQ